MNGNTIWITGASGRLGVELIKVLEENVNNKIIGTDTDIDVTDMHAVNQAAEIYRPTVIINCASISDVDYCEKNMVEAFKVNALGARNLATAARKANAKIIQLSTDDIFEGKKSGSWTEFDTPEPLTVYGKSKLAAENYVRELNPKHLIIRSSWVYGTASGDYFSYVVEHGKNGDKFEAPMDKISSPTSAKELAKFISILIDKAEYGIFHASCEGACSRFDFAKSILINMGYDTTLVKGVFSDNNTHSSTLLENLMMKMTETYDMPHWLDALKAYIETVEK